ncbi:head GIN domain-containing protein [Pedobacter sp. L105]|uniref:head GIN domain-containing protein n=1 Tax=Pedobacter sp. L105 TaxID=1641871 RepID=UPI00131B689C|nr:head GIN domain-containing protein [Pedobacter sp. L105]
MKSLNLIKTALLLMITLCFTIPSVNAQEIRNVAVNDFTSVSVNAGIELIITHGDSESAKILATDKLIDEVSVEQIGTNVDIKWINHIGSKKVWRNRTAKVYITYKNLNHITASSGSSLKTENTLTAEHLDAAVSSGAIIDANITCGELQLQASSGASATFSGKAEKLKLDSSSGSLVNTLGLTTDYANVTASSGAAVKLNVTKELQGITSSGGSIGYKGSATLQDLSGSKKGNVKKID